MEYTEKERITIAIATYGALLDLEHASNLIQVFWERYCENLENPLAYDAEHRHEIIDSQLLAIMHFLDSALSELRPFNEQAVKTGGAD